MDAIEKSRQARKLCNTKDYLEKKKCLYNHAQDIYTMYVSPQANQVHKLTKLRLQNV